MQSRTGGIASVWSFVMAVSLGTNSSYEVLKIQTRLVPLVLKNIRKQSWQYFPLSQSPNCYSAGRAFYMGVAFSSAVKPGT